MTEGSATESRILLFRFMAEGVLIVASILLAFAIDAWWTGRGERALEVQHLLALHEGVTASLDDLHAQGQVSRERMSILEGFGF